MARDDRAVSKPVGVVLMIAVVVVLAALIAAFLFGVGDSLNQPAPNANIDFETVPNAVTEDPSLVVSHGGGTTIKSGNTGSINVLVADRGYFPWAGHGPDSMTGYVDLETGSLAAGDEISVTINGSSSTVSPGDEILVKWTSPSGDNTAILAEYTVPTSASDSFAKTAVSCTVDGTDYSIVYAGSGSSSDPYKVTNATELQCMQGDLDAHYELTQDIDASATSSWNGGAGFEPVGNASSPFTGTFNGNGHDISALTVNRPSTNFVGLFGASSSQVGNVNLVSVSITGNGATAGVVGRADGAVNAVTVSGSVSGGRYAGGVVGFTTSSVSASSSSASVSGIEYVGGLAGNVGGAGVVQNSHATGSVSASNQVAGGLVGNLNGGIQNAYATGDVNSPNAVHVGGLVGSTAPPPGSEPMIAGSYANGSVTGKANVGGLVGDSTNDVIKQSYATGDVSGEETVGGAIGSTAGTTAPDYDGVEHTNVYATGDVTATTANAGGYIGNIGGKNPDTFTYVFSTGSVSAPSDAGGLVGHDADPTNNTVTESYWDTTASGQGSSDGGTGLTTSQMTGSDAETNMTGFDFTSVWRSVASEYPELQWE